MEKWSILTAGMPLNIRGYFFKNSGHHLPTGSSGLPYGCKYEYRLLSYR